MNTILTVNPTQVSVPFPRGIDNNYTTMIIDEEQTDERGNSLLHICCQQGLEEKVKFLVNRGFDVNRQNFEGQTALFLAILNRQLKIAQFLLKAGANPNIANIEGATPLHVASANAFVEFMGLLVQHGAFLNYQDEDGDTPLHYAVREAQFKVVEDLVNLYKADVNVKNEDAESPLQLALCLNDTQMVNILSSPSGVKTEEIGLGGNWRAFRV